MGVAVRTEVGSSGSVQVFGLWVWPAQCSQVCISALNSQPALCQHRAPTLLLSHYLLSQLPVNPHNVVLFGVRKTCSLSQILGEAAICTQAHMAGSFLVASQS